MAYVTYDFKVPYTTRDNAGTRYMTVQAPDNTEAMELVRGMVPGAIVTFPERGQKYSDGKAVDSNPSISVGGCFSSIVNFFVWIFIGAIALAAISYFNDNDEPTNNDERPVQRSIERPPIAPSLPSEPVKPVYRETRKQEPTPCQIWAQANPSLAAKLKEGDKCYGQ